MPSLNLIQCGVGGWGRSWLTEITSHSPDFEIAAIVDVSAEHLEEMGSQIGIPEDRRFTSLENALRSVRADAVLTVTPPSVHLSHCRTSFEHGLPIMTEKPIAGTVEDALEMVRLSKATNCHLLVSQNYRFSAPVQKLRELVSGKVVGGLTHGDVTFNIAANFTGTFRETMDYPLLVDMAIHHFDLIRCITNLDIIRISAAQSFRPIGSAFNHQSAVKILLELTGGIPFSYCADWSARGRQTGWEGDWRLQCSEGSLHLETGKITVEKCEDWNVNHSSEVIELTQLEYSERHATLHLFAETIRSGIGGELMGLNNLLSFTSVMAAIQSAQSQQTVDIEQLIGGEMFSQAIAPLIL